MKPLILITNDDGIRSPGIAAAAEAVADLGELLVVAPHKQQTGMGRAFPREEDTGKIDLTELTINDEKILAYGLHGSPALSVAHGVLELSSRKIDLCISGINYGENVGSILTCSGTLGAAFEASSHGIPAIAASLEMDMKVHWTNEFEDNDWTEAKQMLRKVAEQVLLEGMPKQVDILNINVPKDVQNPGEYRITTQSRQSYFEFLSPPKREFKEPYQLGSRCHIDEKTLEKDSDIYAVHIDKITSITPLSTDFSVKLT